MTDQIEELNAALDEDNDAIASLAVAVRDLVTELQTVQQVNQAVDLSGAIAKAHALKVAIGDVTGTIAPAPHGGDAPTGTTDQGSTGTADQASAGTADQGGTTDQGSTTEAQPTDGTVAPVAGSDSAGTNDSSGADPVVA